MRRIDFGATTSTSSMEKKVFVLEYRHDHTDDNDDGDGIQTIGVFSSRIKAVKSAREWGKKHKIFLLEDLDEDDQPHIWLTICELNLDVIAKEKSSKEVQSDQSSESERFYRRKSQKENQETTNRRFNKSKKISITHESNIISQWEIIY